jgi:hypothetical protein
MATVASEDRLKILVKMGYLAGITARRYEREYIHMLNPSDVNRCASIGEMGSRF